MYGTTARSGVRYVSAVAWIIVVIMQGIGGQVLAAPPAAQVEVILEAEFTRFEGDQTGGASIYPDANSTWFDHTVASPTVDFVLRHFISLLSPRESISPVMDL